MEFTPQANLPFNRESFSASAKESQPSMHLFRHCSQGIISIGSCVNHGLADTVHDAPEQRSIFRIKRMNNQPLPIDPVRRFLGLK
jgi:hypothetical protein